MDIVYLWWCPGCPYTERWQAHTSNEWLDHVNAHIASYNTVKDKIISDGD